MGNEAFVNSVVQEIIQPGLQRLMDGRFFTELRDGKLSIRRLQGWALQQYLRNIALLKGFALCMVKYAHDPQLYNYFLYQLNEEQDHPDLTKRFGLAIGLKEEDFHNTTQIFECLAHTGATIRGMLLGSLPENRTSALVNETMICRHSEEFNTYLRKHYGLGDEACEFFTVHTVADLDHTRRAVEILARHTNSPRDQQVVRETAHHTVRFKLGKFDGIYQAYA